MVLLSLKKTGWATMSRNQKSGVKVAQLYVGFTDKLTFIRQHFIDYA